MSEVSVNLIIKGEKEVGENGLGYLGK